MEYIWKMEHIYVTPDDRLQKIFDQAHPGSVIHLSAGVYRQKVLMRTPNLTILGAGEGKTRIVFDDYARKRGEDGFEYITFRSYTLAVCADGISISNLSVCNDAGKTREKGQQVALSVCGTDFSMENCTLSSTQDTLFLGPLPEDLIERYEGFLDNGLRRGGQMRQVFRNCTIAGSVDFIFGCGAAVFEDCLICSVFDDGRIGFVAAPAHGLHQQEGFQFRNCRFTSEETVENGSVYLARPWRDYGMAVFTDCTYENHIALDGFDKWQGTDRNRTARFYEKPEIPGRVSWINRKTE